MRVGFVRTLANALQEALLPALCVACDGVLAGSDRGLCGLCRSRLVPLVGPFCPRCGRPSDDDHEPCLACVAAPPPQLGTVLWGAYDGVLRQAVLALKHGGRDELARPLARRLAATVGATPWFDRITAVAAVPSHELRRLRRGFSAAGLLADELAASLELRRVSVLRRHGLGRQTGRTRAQRTRLARGVFSARTLRAGHELLLVDDVCTTGTTFRRAAETLLDAGADAIFCGAIAHAPDPRRI